jgi:hypothetical protein
VAVGSGFWGAPVAEVTRPHEARRADSPNKWSIGACNVQTELVPWQSPVPMAKINSGAVPVCATVTASAASGRFRAKNAVGCMAGAAPVP